MDVVLVGEGALTLKKARFQIRDCWFYLAREWRRDAGMSHRSSYIDKRVCAAAAAAATAAERARLIDTVVLYEVVFAEKEYSM